MTSKVGDRAVGLSPEPVGSLLTLVSVITESQDTRLVSQRIVWCETKPHTSGVRNAMSVVVV